MKIYKFKMVFLIDDIADASILGVAWIIFTSLFPEAAESIAATASAVEPEIMAAIEPEVVTSSISVPITKGSSIVLIQDLLGDEGLETAVDIVSGDFKNYAEFPVGQKEIDMAEQVLGEIGMTETESNNPGLVKAVGRIINSVSQKINPDNKGFIQLIGDVVKPLLQNPGQTIGTATAIGGGLSAAGTFGYSALQKIKSAFDKDENLPNDIQQKIINNKQPQAQDYETGDENLQSATDQVIGNLPMTIF